jgi:hypothetical protein
MDYVRVEWRHDDPDDPVVLFAERDDDRWEVRKVDVFRDGSLIRADADTDDAAGTALGQIPTPPLDEINADPHFAAVSISREEFEDQWLLATPASGTFRDAD